MANQRTLVIIGAGLAGAKAAEGARKAGFDGRVVLIGDEPGLPYERPPFSKGVLRGEDEPDSANVHGAEFYSANNINLLHERVESLDTEKREIRSPSGEIPFDVAVLATGSRARKLTIPGSDLAGVLYLRTRDDSLKLRDAIRSASRVCVIGGGWIGTEVAASAKQMGADVLLANGGSTLLGHVMGQTIGNIFQRLHVENGVDVRNNLKASELRGNGHVEAIVFDDGSVEEVDIVVAGIGAEPNLEIPRLVGLNIDSGGVVVDEYLATNVPDVYAIGDIASAWHPFYERHIRVEHWSNALNQGKRVGANIAGERKPYENLPYFYTDQFDLGMEYVGLADPNADVTIRGDLEKREFIAYWHEDGVVSAAMNVNVWDVVEDLKKIIRSRRSINEV